MLRLVHPTTCAVQFRFPMDAVRDLCRLSKAQLTGTPLEFGTRVVDATGLQHGWTANLGVTHMATRKGLLEALPFGGWGGDWGVVGKPFSLSHAP